MIDALGTKEAVLLELSAPIITDELEISQANGVLRQPNGVFRLANGGSGFLSQTHSSAVDERHAIRRA